MLDFAALTIIAPLFLFVFPRLSLPIRSSQIWWGVIDFAASGFVYFVDEGCGVVAFGVA
jgi:hypothetical protein